VSPDGLKANWYGPTIAWLLNALSDRRAMAAVEFAFVAPIMIGLYVGAVEFGNALTIERRTSEVASTAADLAAQVKTVSTSDLQDITSAASSILTPFSTTPLKIVLSSVVADPNNNTKVDWSYATNGASPRAKNSVFTVPAGLTQANSSVIVAEVTYAFTPLLNLTAFPSPGSFNMSRTYFSRPRKSLTVTKSN
jgi:Flp pilus assembly protein TadG